MTSRLRLVGATALACAGAATAFGALFRGWGWLAPVLLVILVVLAVSEAVRSSPLPTALGPLLATLAALLFGTAYFAGSVAVWHLLPGAAARHRLATLLHDGAAVVHQYAAPVPARHGAVLLVVIGVAAVTLVVDLCALTLDRAAFAVLPLLAVYVVASLLTHHGIGWRVFLLTAAGVLLLLAADTAEARRRWGRRFAGAGSHEIGLRGAGRGVALAALGLALVVPALLPGLHNLHPHGDGVGNSPGGHAVTTVNPLVSLNTELRHASNEQVLTYRTRTLTPPYLRLTSLDRFDGTQFTAVELHSSTSRVVAPGVPLAATPSPDDVRTFIDVSTLAERWAPMPGRPVDATLPGSWRFDPVTGSVWTTSTTTQFMQYQVDSSPERPSASELRRIGYDSYGTPTPGSVGALDVGVPANIPARVVDLAQRLRKSTPYDTALAIQDHFLTGQFAYDLNVPPTDSVNALTDFLFQRRIGYCQQYASAMALLARLDGIPARVAVGFTPGVRDGNGNWIVTGADAHSWPELFFPGLGWLPFEPTPRGDGQTQMPSYAVDRSHGHGQDPNAIVKNHNLKKSQHPAGAGRSARPHATKSPHAAARRGGRSGSGGLFGLAAVLVLALCLLLPAAVRFAGRQRHAHPHGPAAAAHSAWCEVHDSVVDLGFDWPLHRSPQQTVRLLLRTIPALAPVQEPLRRIAVAEQQARYAPVITADVGSALRSDVGAVRHALFARAGRGQRLRAAVLPRSSLQAFRARVRAGVPLPRRERVRAAQGYRSVADAARRNRPRPPGPPGRRS